LTPGIALASLACAACLPLGTPPRGHHELPGRDLDGVGFIQPAPGRATTLFARRSSPTFTTPCESRTSLFTLDEPAATMGLATEKPLADHVERRPAGIYTNIGLFQYALPTDARGRVFLTTQFPAPALENFGCPAGNATLERLDPATGARTVLGPLVQLQDSAQLSEDRTRVAFASLRKETDMVSSMIVVRDLDDHEIVFDGTSPRFVGNDLYAVDSMGTLVVLKPDGTRTSPLANASSIDVAFTARGPIVMVYPAYSQDHAALPMRLFDSVAGAEIAPPLRKDDSGMLVPAGISGAQVSPSGRYVMLTDVIGAYDPTGETLVTLLDRDTGIAETRTWAGGQTLGWRPGKDEYWQHAGTTLRRWKPGQPTLTTSIDFPDSGFTANGLWWLIFDGVNTEARSADDPEAAGFMINPPAGRAWTAVELPDGRLIVHAEIGPYGRFDIYLVDPAARTRKPLGSGGFVIGASNTRALAMLDWSIAPASGDLALIDLETGAIEVLAENTYRIAVEPVGPGGDILAPGLRVASIVRSRLPSTYDGLWTTTLP
jgi:hypothetical protein